MHLLESYLEELAALRRSGAVSKETSGYLALASLLNAVAARFMLNRNTMMQVRAFPTKSSIRVFSSSPHDEGVGRGPRRGAVP